MKGKKEKDGTTLMWGQQKSQPKRKLGHVAERGSGGGPKKGGFIQGRTAGEGHERGGRGKGEKGTRKTNPTAKILK